MKMDSDVLDTVISHSYQQLRNHYSLQDVVTPCLVYTCRIYLSFVVLYRYSCLC